MLVGTKAWAKQLISQEKEKGRQKEGKKNELKNNKNQLKLMNSKTVGCSTLLCF